MEYKYFYYRAAHTVDKNKFLGARARKNCLDDMQKAYGNNYIVEEVSEDQFIKQFSELNEIFNSWIGKE